MKDTYEGRKEGKLFSLNFFKSEFSSSLNYNFASFFLPFSFSFSVMSALKSGLYCSLYEVVEKSRSGSHLEGLLQKLEKERLVSATDLTIPVFKNNFTS